MKMKQLFAVMGIGLGVITLSMLWAIVNMALASIQKDLYASILHLQWMMNAFGIFLCAPLLAMGKLGDAYGRKPFYTLGLCLTVIASFFAGNTDHLWVLIICMAFFGLSGSMILPLSQALLVHQFPEAEKQKAVAIWGMFVSFSLASGPMIGGLILGWFSWRWIYFANIPIALTSLITVFFFVKNEKPDQKVVCEWLSIGLLALFVATFILSIMQGPIWGWLSWEILTCFAISIFALYLFTRVEKKSKDPLFRTDLFANRTFLCSAIPNGCTIGFIWVIFFIIPLYLQNVLRFSPLKTGGLFLVVTLPVFFFSKLVSRSSLPYKTLMVFGFSLFAITFFMQMVFKASFGLIALSCLIMGFGWVLAWGPAMSSALKSISHQLAGTASGMFTTLQEFSSVTSLSIAGVFFHITQSRHLQSHLKEMKETLNVSQTTFNSLISNPAAVAERLGANSEITFWVTDAFLAAYQSVFCFLFLLSLFAIAMTLLIPGRLHDKCIDK